MDSRTFLLENFTYDGQGPETYFWSGNASVPNGDGFWLLWTDENDQLLPLGKAFSGENITVTLPQPQTVYDITYISVWCNSVMENFGHVSFDPDTLNVPAFIKSDMPYYGKRIGQFSTLAHDVSGEVFAVDQSRILIHGFNYDGAAPDAFLWVGNTDQPSTEGMALFLDDREEKLGAYTNGIIVVTMPVNTNITGYKWISVWCRNFRVNFGHVMIPSNLELPDEHDLGTLPTTAHDVHADHVWVLNSKTFFFVNFVYDGNGPDTYFWAGSTMSPDENGFWLKWTTGDDQILPNGRPFNKENVTVTIPDDMTVFDITYVGIWCQSAKADFGHINFNGAMLNVPAVLDSDDMTQFSNCKVLIDDEFQVSWTVTGSRIRIRLSGRVDKGQYLAFGLSGSDTRTLMDGSDVAVLWEQSDTSIEAVDYNLHSKQQCTLVDTSRVGACEDTVAGGVDNIEFSSFSQVNGVREFIYTRSLNTGDAIDKVIPTDREVYISWAIGSINPDGRVAKHTKAPVGDVKINFGSASSTCPAFTDKSDPGPDMKPWPKLRLNNAQEFRVEIGQNGGKRGYESITGQVGWGIAWYVNELLIPEIYVVRGVNYSFTVFGGDNTAQSAMYHPFYITNDTVGGYAQQSEDERKYAVIYSGPHVGPYCEWKVRVAGTSPDDFDNFPAYKDNLELVCNDPSAEGTKFYWTPDRDTPDLVYYQCYTHRFLGWKMHVTDEPVILVPTNVPPKMTTSDESSTIIINMGMLVATLLTVLLF